MKEHYFLFHPRLQFPHLRRIRGPHHTRGNHIKFTGVWSIYGQMRMWQSDSYSKHEDTELQNYQIFYKEEWLKVRKPFCKRFSFFGHLWCKGLGTLLKVIWWKLELKLDTLFAVLHNLFTWNILIEKIFKKP
jgi:hypothetical protein